MYHLKLCKGRSYNGIIKASKEHPMVYTESKQIADAAVATGFFILLEGRPETVQEITPPQSPNLSALENMNKKQLVEAAELYGVDISDAKNNAERVAMIIEGTGGSLTMIDLQKEGE